LDDRKVSRRHCEIRVEADRTAVFDLGSQNGCYIGKSRLPVRKAMTWRPELPLRIGPFVLYLSQEEEAEEQPRPVVERTPAAPAPRARTKGRSRRIACGLAKPSVVDLSDRPITIGRSKSCEMVLDDPGISPRQVKLELQGDQIRVTDLGKNGATQVGGRPLAPGASAVWSEGSNLQVGPFFLVQSVGVTTPRSATAVPDSIAAPSDEPDGDIGARMWQEWMRQLPWIPIALVAGAICLVLGAAVGVAQLLTKPDPTATPIALATPSEVIEATSTPIPEETMAVQVAETPSPTIAQSGEWLPTEAPPPTPPPTLVCVPQSAGWLDLPFPYDGRNVGFGTADQFRSTSQRVAAGGRITSFFDHEYPLYKQGEGKYESAQVNDTLVLFDGSRSLDKWSHPDQVGDYYSGHPGLDFSTFEWGKATTPVLAPADGVLLGSGVDNLGNYYVHLEHDQGDDGMFRTSYLHLEDDEFFAEMLATEPGTPVKAGDRIGTMGNTGNSSGHHLHFEVRRDCNGDGLYELAEAVDPYGFMPSLEISTDPLSSGGLPCGASQYLWRYTWEAGDDGGCENRVHRRQLDPTPFQGRVSISSFIFSTADPSTTTRVPIWLADAELEKVDIQTVSVYRFDVPANNWVIVPDTALRLRDGRYFIEASLNIPGKYTVTGKPVEDIIPPTTRIVLSGPQQDGAFTGAISVELIGQDEGEGVREIRYSIDCGQTWEVYGDRSFSVSRSSLVSCGTSSESHDGDEWGLEENDYLILAAAADWAGNWEQPPSLLVFKTQ
jgi:murein DD-endopeptidase MepM/ murein hydrolase activator NlpD